MLQAAAVYVLVAAAAAWVVWSMMLPKMLRTRLKARLRRSG